MTPDDTLDACAYCGGSRAHEPGCAELAPRAELTYDFACERCGGELPYETSGCGDCDGGTSRDPSVQR